MKSTCKDLYLVQQGRLMYEFRLDGRIFRWASMVQYVRNSVADGAWYTGVSGVKTRNGNAGGSTGNSAHGDFAECGPRAVFEHLRGRARLRYPVLTMRPPVEKYQPTLPEYDRTVQSREVNTTIDWVRCRILATVHDERFEELPSWGRRGLPGRCAPPLRQLSRSCRREKSRPP